MARQTVRPLPIGFKGARAEETERSRLGIQSGVFGVHGATREWRVYCPGRADNPFAVIRSLSSSLGGAREGDNYPWAEMSSMVLLYFVLVDRWPGTKVNLVQGIYGPPLLYRPAPNTWNYRISTTGDTEEILSELPWRNENDVLISRGIGTPEFVKLPDTASNNTFTAETKKGTVKLNLATGGNDLFHKNLRRYVEGASRLADTTALQIWRSIPAWRHEAVRMAFMFKNRVNSDSFSTITRAGNLTWADAPEQRYGGIVLFAGVQVEETQAPVSTEAILQNTTNPGDAVAFNVALNFIVNPRGHQYERTFTYKDDDTNLEGPVSWVPGQAPPDFSEQDLLREKFLRYYDAPLTSIVGAFG